MEKKLYEQMTELVNWLNDECPAVAPPLEPYTTADLSHYFAEGLRIRLDEIDILRSAMANKPYTAVSGSLPLASAECDHPYALVYRKGDYEVCLKCNKVLCEG